jgi:hypothetical protein
MQRPRFDQSDVERAFNEWGANCGPGAIAAICGLTLDELRPHMGDFEQKRYTNPTLMWAVLDRLGVKYRQGRWHWPSYGLVRIQWEGPWTKPGVPMRARYRYTHWVGAATTIAGSVGVFDINAINNGSGWVSQENWASTIVPWILRECHPKADGKWHITHVVEVQRPEIGTEGVLRRGSRSGERSLGVTT